MPLSKREKLNQLNAKRANVRKNAPQETTIVDEMLETYTQTNEKKESKPAKAKSTSKAAPKEAKKEPLKEEKKAPVEEAAPIMNEPVVAEAPAEPEKVEEAEIPVVEESIVVPQTLINVTDKSAVGRPKRPGVYKMASIKLKEENYIYGKAIGGVYGGLTGYINYLIEQDRKNHKAN